MAERRANTDTTGADNNQTPPLSPAADIEDLITAVETGGTITLAATTKHLCCDADTTNRILTAADAADTDLCWAGQTIGDWELPELEGNLIINGTVRGSLLVAGSVGGFLSVYGSVLGSLVIDGSIGQALTIAGSVCEDLDINESSSISRTLYISGSVDGTVTVSGSVGGDLIIADSGLVADFGIDGAVDGSVRVAGSMTGQLLLAPLGAVGDRLTITGRAGELVLSGSIGQECTLTPGPGEPVPLRSMLGARFGDDVFIGDRVRIDDCDFRRCADLDKLRLVGSNLFPPPAARVERAAVGKEKRLRWWKGRSIAALTSTPTSAHSRELGPVTDAELAVIYRQLRAGLEGRKDRPTAGRFYVGETDARRRDARAQRRWVEWFVLAAYRAMSGYGLRTGRAVGWFVLVAIAGTGLLLVNGLDLDPEAGAVDRASVVEAFTFTVKSMVSFVSPPTAGLTVTEEWIQLGLRFSGPVLLAQAVLAVRERVAR